MTSGTPAQVGSLPHEMIAWKAAAEDLAAQRDRLAHRVEQLEAALRETRERLLTRGYRPDMPVVEHIDAALSGVSP